MPNPLTQMFRDTSKRPPRNPGIAGVEERDINHTDPELEYYEGDNNAYRGIEPHGVATDSHATAFEPRELQDQEAPVVNWREDPEPEAPIAVRVVGEYSREERMARLFSMPVGSTPIMIIGKREGRKSVRISNAAITSISSSNAPVADLNQTQTARTATGNGNEYTIPATGWTNINYILNVTSNAGTTPSWSVYIQETLDGTNFVNAVTLATGVTGTGTFRATSGPISSRQRIRWVLDSGTATDFTFNVRATRFPVTTTQAANNAVVYLSSDSSVNPVTSYRLEGGGAMTIATEHEIWAVCADSTQTVLQIMDEYSVEIP